MATSIQPKITIIITPPMVQGNTNRGRDMQEKSQKKHREKSRKTGTPRTNTTNEEETKKEQEQGHQRNAETNTYDGNSANTRKDTSEETETEEPHYVTIQTSAGSYEEGLIVDKSNNCPLLERHNITRYRIPEQPLLMRNIQKFYTAKKLPPRHVLKFDIQGPAPHHRLWRKTKRTLEHTHQECIFDAKENTNHTRNDTSHQEKNTRNNGRTNKNTPRTRENMTTTPRNNTYMPIRRKIPISVEQYHSYLDQYTMGGRPQPPGTRKSNNLPN